MSAHGIERVMVAVDNNRHCRLLQDLLKSKKDIPIFVWVAHQQMEQQLTQQGTN